MEAESYISGPFLSLDILGEVYPNIQPDMISTHFYYSVQVAVHKKEDIFYVLDNSNKKWQKCTLGSRFVHVFDSLACALQIVFTHHTVLKPFVI